MHLMGPPPGSRGPMGGPPFHQKPMEAGNGLAFGFDAFGGFNLRLCL
jgi:hypothetical protein